MASLLLFMFAGPFYRQLLDGRNTYLPRWVMFRNAAINLVQAEFFIEGPDEERLKIEPFDTNSLEAPHRIVGREELESIIAELKVDYRGQGGDALVVNARIAKHRGWKGLYEGRRFELER
jgi:hypothetical protein